MEFIKRIRVLHTFISFDSTKHQAIINTQEGFGLHIYPRQPRLQKTL
jgi:hypothetical protein